MPSFVVRLDDGQTAYYMIWSTIVDAPISPALPRAGLVAWYRDRYGSAGVGWTTLPERLARADAWGTSSLAYTSAGELIAGNRAGPGETCLTREQILDRYARNRPPEP